MRSRSIRFLPAMAFTLLLSLTLAPVSALSAEPSEGLKESAPASDAAKSTDEPSQPAKAERRLISITNSKTALDVRQWPLLGSPDAKYVFVEMFDYTCPHCRATHAAVQGAMKRYGDDLAIIALPTPLDRNCNNAAPERNSFRTDACAISRMSIAVWRVDPKQFARFHSWLFQQSRTAAEATRYANELVGEKALRDELTRGMAEKYIAKNIQLYQRAGSGSVPKLLFPKSTLTGEVSSTEKLCSIIERELGKRQAE